MFKTYQVAASGPDVHHDTLLSNVAVQAFSDGTDTFIADQLLPAVPVPKQSDKYIIISRGAFLRNYEALRAPKTVARKIEFQVSSDSYFCDDFALAGEMALEDIDNSDNVFALRENTTRQVTNALRRAQEIRIANLLTSASNLGSGAALTGTNKWSDYLNSDPVGDVNTAQAFIQHNTGLIANTMVLDYDTMKILRRHPDLLDLYKYTAGGQLTMQQLQDTFTVDRILIGRGVKENALDGGTSSMTNIWSNVAILAYIEMAALGMQTRTLALRFQWAPPSFPAAFAAATRRDAGPGTRNVEIVQAEHFQAEKMVAPELGYVITGTL